MRMKKHITMLTAGAVGLAVIATGPPSFAEEQAPVPIAVELLTARSSFTDNVSMQIRLKLDGARTKVIKLKDPSRTVVARITVQPDAHFPWHTHPGPVIVQVVKGELTYVNANDCVLRVYPEGSSFVDPGLGNVHTAFNSAADEVTELMATFFQAPAEGPLTITEGIEPPDDCDVETGSHDSH